MISNVANFAPWQQRVYDQAVAALDAGRLAHGLLFCGPAKLGKRAVAERLARRVLCQQPGGKVLDGVQTHILVGRGDSGAQRGGQQRQHAAPHAFIGREAGQEQKLGGMGHG